MKRSYQIAFIVVPILATAKAFPITERFNLWSYGGEGDDLFWMWWVFVHFTLGLVVAGWWLFTDMRGS